MKSILITGCNRGIGLGLIRNFLKIFKDSSTKLIATYRDVNKAEELQELTTKNENLHLIQFDVTNFDSYREFTNKITSIVANDGLNVLFNNAGYSPKYTRINFVKVEQMMHSYIVNTVAPIMLTKTMLPLLKRAAENNSTKPLGVERAAVINMSSILGSVSLNSDGGYYPYRCSKSALNMATKSLSIDLKNDGILATCIHPGWVKTSMGGPNAPLDVDVSSEAILKLLPQLNASHNGNCYQYDGQQLQW